MWRKLFPMTWKSMNEGGGDVGSIWIAIVVFIWIFLFIIGMIGVVLT